MFFVVTNIALEISKLLVYTKKQYFELLIHSQKNEFPYTEKHAHHQKALEFN